MNKTYEQHEQKCNDILDKMMSDDTVPEYEKVFINNRIREVMSYAKIAHDALDELDKMMVENELR